jgi:hypothetical protein
MKATWSAAVPAAGPATSRRRTHPRGGSETLQVQPARTPAFRSSEGLLK